MIKDSIDSGKFGCDIFIDLRKAFDTVNRLLLKKEGVGKRGSRVVAKNNTYRPNKM